MGYLHSKENMILGNELWSEHNLKSHIKEPILDYGRIAWQHTLEQLSKPRNPQAKESTISNFVMDA